MNCKQPYGVSFFPVSVIEVTMDSRIRQAMEAMLKLNNGKAAAHKLAERFRDAYRRCTSLIAEISKF